MDRKKFIIISIMSFLACFASFIIEYSGLAAPCKLCYYQRYLHIALWIMTLIALYITSPQKKNQGMIYIAMIYIFIFIIIIGQIAIGTFHVGLEHHWWSMKMQCTTQSLQSMSLKEYNEYINTNDLVACDTSTFFILGLSLAELNVLYSILIFILFLRFCNKRGV